MRKIRIQTGFLVMLFVVIICCANSFLPENDTNNKIEQSKEFNAYWYDNHAEITNYSLKQARYGEVHSGNATMVFVTEPFSIGKQVKTDVPDKGDYSVMKLNFAKKFTTGVYPYSMMTSSFIPVDHPAVHPLKTTTTTQEWCGHTFTQLNWKNGKYKISSFSYFEEEGDQKFELEEQWLEDEIWTKIRLNPELLPVGKTEMIPSLFYARLMHKEIKAYQVDIVKTELNDSTISYEIYYPELDRELKIKYTNRFPFMIESWSESYVSGWGNDAQKLITSATKIKAIKSDYWIKNKKTDTWLRTELGFTN